MMAYLVIRNYKKNLLRLIGLFLLFLIIISNYLLKDHDNFTGIFLIFDHIYNFLLVFLLLCLCTSFGLFLLSRCRHLFAEPLEILLFSSAIGIGVIATIIMFLGFFSLLNHVAIGILLLTLSLLSRNNLKEVIILIGKSGIYLKNHCSLLNLLIFGSVAFFLLCLASAPPIDWDALVYHIQVPDLFLKANKIFLPYDNLNASVVQLIHMLYVPLLAFGNSSVPALFSTFMSLMLGLAVFEFCNRFFNSDVAGSSLVLFYASTVILIVSITPRVDVTVAFFLFIAHYLLIKSHINSLSTLFYLSAILLGFAFGVKYNAGLYILALSPLIVWTAFSAFPNRARSLKSLGFFILLFLCTSSPWLVKNWFLLKSPFYPFFTGRQLPSWVNHLSTLRPVIDPEIYKASFQIGTFFNFKDFFLHPARLTIEPEGFFYFANLVLLFLPLCLFFLKESIVLWLALPSLLFVIALNLFWPHSNLRYLIPALPPLTILAVYAIWSAGARFLSMNLNKILLLILTIFIVLPNLGRLFLFWPSNSSAFQHFVGTISREDYLRNHPMPVASTYADTTSYVNHNLSKNNKILFMFEGRGYHFKIPVIQDTDGINWPLISQDSLNPAVWNSMGISHILVNFGNLNYLVNRGLNPGLYQWQKFLVFARTCLDPIHNNRAYILYKIKDPLPDLR